MKDTEFLDKFENHVIAISEATERLRFEQVNLEILNKQTWPFIGYLECTGIEAFTSAFNLARKEAKNFDEFTLGYLKFIDFIEKDSNFVSLFVTFLFYNQSFLTSNIYKGLINLINNNDGEMTVAPEIFDWLYNEDGKYVWQYEDSGIWYDIKDQVLSYNTIRRVKNDFVPYKSTLAEKPVTETIVNSEPNEKPCTSSTTAFKKSPKKPAEYIDLSSPINEKTITSANFPQVSPIKNEQPVIEPVYSSKEEETPCKIIQFSVKKDTRTPCSITMSTRSNKRINLNNITPGKKLF